MRSPFERLLLLLAASQIPEEDIYEALQTADGMGPSKVTKAVYSLRRQIRSISSNSIRASETKSPYTQVAEDVYRLLVVEASIPAVEAGAMLYNSISSYKGRKAIPPYRSKDGFRRWLVQISKLLPESEILHHATKLRNQAVHSVSETDWPLRQR